MKRFFHKPALSFTKLVLLLILVIIFSSLVIVAANFDRVKIFALPVLSTYLEKFGIQQTSKVKAQIVDNKLSLKFQIDNSDKEALERLLNRIDISKDFLEGVTLTLDQEGAQKVEMILPDEVDFKALDKKIVFVGQSKKLLESAVPVENYSIASGSGNLSLKVYSGNDYDLLINDPGSLWQLATASGSIKLSRQLEGLFPIVAKIARIEVIARDKKISGEMDFK